MPLVEIDNSEGSEERLQKLASFQLLMIRHAMQCTYSLDRWPPARPKVEKLSLIRSSLG